MKQPLWSWGKWGKNALFCVSVKDNKIGPALELWKGNKASLPMNRSHGGMEPKAQEFLCTWTPATIPEHQLHSHSQARHPILKQFQGFTIFRVLPWKYSQLGFAQLLESTETMWQVSLLNSPVRGYRITRTNLLGLQGVSWNRLHLLLPQALRGLAWWRVPQALGCSQPRLGASRPAQSRASLLCSQPEHCMCDSYLQV